MDIREHFPSPAFTQVKAADPSEAYGYNVMGHGPAPSPNGGVSFRPAPVPAADDVVGKSVEALDQMKPAESSSTDQDQQQGSNNNLNARQFGRAGEAGAAEGEAAGAAEGIAAVAL